MGVHNLWRLLDTFGEVTQPEKWRGKRIAVDASIWIAQFRARFQTGENIEQRILEGFLLRILKLLFYGIEPVFVFDRVATNSKWEEQRRRAERRDAQDRVALRKRAREILTAQVSAGVLDVSALKRRSPVKTTSKVVEDIGSAACKTSNNESDDESSVLEEESKIQEDRTKKVKNNFEWRKALSTQRGIPLTPESVSMAVTNAFLTDARETIEESKRGARCNEANALHLFTSSLFMGPRHVVDESATVPSECTDVDSEKDVVVCSGSEGQGSYYEVNSEESYSSSLVFEGMHSSDKCSEDLVVVLDRAPDSFTGHLREIEYEDQSVMKKNGMDTDSDAEDISEGIESTDDSASSGFPKTNAASQNSFYLWNPNGSFIRKVDAPSASQDKVIDISGEHSVSPSLKKTGEPREVRHSGESVLPVVSTYASRQTSSKPQVIPFDLIEIVELLDCCGIPYVLSPYEADAQCAFLNQTGLVDAVFSEDSDVIVHGAPVVLRGFFAKGRQVVAYRQSDLAACGVDKAVLAALALLLGCDYAEGAAGLSLLAALEVIASVWRPDDGEGAARVLAMLRRWRAVVAGVPARQWEEDGSTLAQFIFTQANREKWATVGLPGDFPQVQAVEAFFEAPVDTDVSSFAKALPDWQRLRAFVATHGLLANSRYSQYVDLVQKERSRQIDVDLRGQRLLTDFGVQTLHDEGYVFKKQPVKFSGALAFLRSVK